MQEEIYKNLSLEDLPGEEWSDVVGYEGLYQVSNLGRVKSLPKDIRRGRGIYHRGCIIMKPIINGNGYYQVTLFSNNNKKKIRLIHNIMLEAFVQNPNNYTECDHINTIKTDNRLENLRWANRDINMNNPLTKYHRRKAIKVYCRNPDYIKKQRNNQPYMKPVLQYTLDMDFVKEHISLMEASRYVNGNISSISRCCKGIQKTACGYIWKYK